MHLVRWVCLHSDLSIASMYITLNDDFVNDVLTDRRFKALCGLALSENRAASSSHPKASLKGQLPVVSSVIPQQKHAASTHSDGKPSETKPTLVGKEKMHSELKESLSRELRGVRLDGVWKAFDRDVSKNDEFCIKNEEFCIKNEELCIKNEGSCIKNEEFCI